MTELPLPMLILIYTCAAVAGVGAVTMFVMAFRLFTEDLDWGPGFLCTFVGLVFSAIVTAIVLGLIEGF